MVLPQVSKSEDLQEVGRKIRHYREKKKMSQLELAEAIGVTQNTIYLIETARSEMKLEKLFRIAEVLDVTPKGSIKPKHKEGNCDQRSLLSVFGLWVWKLSDV